jgi:hypothetical protein
MLQIAIAVLLPGVTRQFACAHPLYAKYVVMHLALQGFFKKYNNCGAQTNKDQSQKLAVTGWLPGGFDQQLNIFSGEKMKVSSRATGIERRAKLIHFIIQIIL